MEGYDVKEVEQVILDVLKTTCEGMDNITMDTPLVEINLKSIQLISVSALLEDKLGYAPNFRALLNMEKVGDIRDYIVK